MRVEPKMPAASESGDFDYLAAVEENLDQPEALANNPAISEEFSNLSRTGVGANIKIFRSFAQIKVTDTAAHQIGGKASIPQPVQNFERFPINMFPRDWVFGPRDDQGFR